MSKQFYDRGMNRMLWSEAPDHVHEHVAERAGSRVVRAYTPPGGYTQGVAARLDLADGRTIFLKAIAADGVQSDGYRQEIFLTRMLPIHPALPRHLWSEFAEDGTGWHLLCTEYVPGGPANLRPGSPHVDYLVGLMSSLRAVLSPSSYPGAPQFRDLVAGQFARWSEPEFRSTGLCRYVDRMRRLEHGWEPYSEGDMLTHNDIRADNVLLDARGFPVIVDWSTPHVAAPWIEAAFTVPRLIMTGHTSSQAESTLRQLLDAPEEAITSFAVALAGHWLWSSRQKPMPGMPDLRKLQEAQGAAAFSWALYREKH